MNRASRVAFGARTPLAPTATKAIRKRRRTDVNAPATQPQPSATRQARSRQQLDVQIRVIIAHHLYVLLDDEDRALAHAGRPQDINFKRYQVRTSADSRSHSPVTLTDDFMRNHHAERYKLSPETGRKAVRKWFDRFWTTGDVEDLPRAVKVGANLGEEDWEFLRRCLIVFKWEDAAGNQRRFGTLQAAKEHFSKLGEAQKVGQLEDILTRSRARSLRHLQGEVMHYFDLVLVKESFKDPRDQQKAYHCAHRLLGRQPMLEYYRSTQPSPGIVHHCKIMKRLPLSSSGKEASTATDYYLDSCEVELMGNLDGFKIETNVPTQQLGGTICK